MAILTQSDALMIAANKSRSSDLEDAQREELRAKFHTEAFSPSASVARQDFLTWVGNLIDPTKLKVFEHLMVNPIATIDVSESIFNEVNKVLDAQDRYIGHQFVNEDQRKDFRKYLQSINESAFWNSAVMMAIKNSYHSFIIVDLPTESPDGEANEEYTLKKLPKPYCYLLPIENVIHVDFDKVDREVEYIFFKDTCNENLAYLFDDLYLRTFQLDDKREWKLVNEITHDLGYTPAKQLWDVPLRNGSNIRKRGLLTNSLGNLDKLLFKIVSESHVELYAEYPIMSMFEEKCDYVHDTGATCENGKILHSMKEGLAGSPSLPTYIACPRCNGAKKSLGAGTIFEAPAMAKSDDPNLIDGVHFVSMPVENLKWIAEKVSTLKNELTYSIIGVVDEVSGVAINKDQVASQYESRQNVLMLVKSNLEKAHQWTHETLAKYRYGKAFISATVNYGSKFFLQTVAQLNDAYKLSRESGIPAFELANQRIQMYETKYRSNPELLQRIRILMAIEPFQDYTIEQIKSFTSVDPEWIALKLNFDNYVQQFEREYTNVVNFMPNADFGEKISIITEILLGYVRIGLQKQTQLNNNQNGNN